MLLNNILPSILFYFVFGPNFVAPEDGFVCDYDPDTYKRQIEELDGNFIMFYAPWCRHCTDFYPMWSELAELVNTKDSQFAIAQVDCTVHARLCHNSGITGYPTLLYYHKNSFHPVEYKGTRDLPSLTLFLSEVFNTKTETPDKEKETSDVKIYSGMAYLNENNIEKFVSKGQHFIMFYAPWCQACQQLSPTWAELAVHFVHNEYIQIGKLNCVDNEMTCRTFDIKQYPYLMWIVNGRIMGVTDASTLDDLKAYVETMLQAENHDPEKFMKKKKALPVARISEETFETFMEKDLVFVNYFAPWCAHCMQLGPLWLRLGERFLNDLSQTPDKEKETSDVKIYSGMAYLNENNIEKFVSKGQHFIMFYAPWCQACQQLSPTWAELAVHFVHNEYIQIGKLNCVDNEMTCRTFDIKQYPYLMWIVNGRIMGVTDASTLDDLKAYVETMLQAENHDPEKFMKKKKALPVARISEETFETFMEKDLVFVNYFAPWCAHCMQLGPLWLRLGERFLNDSRVLIADVDCVQSKQICETEKINGLPTLILYKQKKIVNVDHGSRPLESLISLVNEHLEENKPEEQKSDKIDTTKDEL